MIAAIEKDNELHVVKWTGRVRLHAGIVTYCDLNEDAAKGVLQVPEQVFTRGVSFTLQPGVVLKPCPKCRMISQAAIS